MRDAFERGAYAKVSSKLAGRLPTDRSDRSYMLQRMNLSLSLLADGRPAAAEPVVNRVFEVLRTQGVNDDKTVAAAVFGEEGVIFWKGEPFEQAMMFNAIAVQKGALGQWDNMRAASQSSLFLLKDFGENERGNRKTTEEIAGDAYREAERRGDDQAYETYLDKGYTPAKTDFALGYFMNAAANLAMYREGGDPARLDEARDNFREAFTLRPGLKPVADALVEGGANTILIVDYGPGPEKIRYGPDGALARFAPRITSDERPIALRTSGGASSSGAVAADLNQMASDHMWNNLEDLRSAKSSIGTALLVAGAITTSAGNDRQFGGAQVVGLALMGAGLLTKLTAGADTRHCELLPQRTYVAALTIDRPGTAITLDTPGLRIELPWLDPPVQGRATALHYVRVPMGPEAARWASSGRLMYAPDGISAEVAGDDLPYIMGGRCVRKPSLDVLQRYQRAGNLLDYSVNDLANLYQAEELYLGDDPQRLVSGVHVLEGGDLLDPPMPGSAGFLRLFCQPHEPYQPRSDALRRAIERHESTRASSRGLANTP